MSAKKDQIADSAGSQLTAGEQPTAAIQGNDIPASYKETIAASFNILEAAYNTQFAASFKDVAKLKFAMRVWAEQLHPLPADAISQAIAELCRTQEFMPSLALVRQRALRLALGAPTAEDAFAEACEMVQRQGDDERNWSHPTVRQAVVRISAQSLRNQSRDVKREFIAVYKDVLETALQ